MSRRLLYCCFLPIIIVATLFPFPPDRLDGRSGLPTNTVNTHEKRLGKMLPRLGNYQPQMINEFNEVVAGHSMFSIYNRFLAAQAQTFL